MSTPKTKPRNATKPFTKMTAAELQEATKEFDKPADLKEWRQMTPDERARWERVRRGGSARGRPRIGSGSGTVLVPVSMERSLLQRADVYAGRLGVKRSFLVAKALERLMKDGDKADSRKKEARPARTGKKG